MKKTSITIILVLFFILGFSFKYFFDFKSLPKANTSQNSFDLKSAARIGENLTSPQNIPQLQPQINISDLARAQEEPAQSQNNSYITPDQNPNFLPIRDWSVPFIEISAKAAITTDQTASKIYYQKNIFEKLPVASLTKLMTATIVLETEKPDTTVIISKKAVDQEGEAGKLIVSEEITIENLLKALLIESSNDAAFALEEYFDSKNIDLINLMNQKAIALDLKNTHFVSSSGIEDDGNYSTAYDFARLVAYSLNNEQLWNILKLPSARIISADGSNIRNLTTSNQLLGKIEGLIGGKTGYTLKAKGCLLIVVAVNPDTKIITVVLGSDDRFGETEKLINWIKSAYRFN